jgi:hypothetical protein
MNFTIFFRFQGCFKVVVSFFLAREKVPGIDMQLVLKKVAIESDGPDRNDKDLKVQKLRSLTSVCFINYVFTRV